MASSGYPFPEDPAGDVEARQRAKDGEIVKATWKGRIWDTFDLPPLERKLLFKVDAVMLTFASLGYFLKNLDQQNINSAFLSGMKEDLDMHGNELVTAVTIWTVGYVIGQIPSNMLLTRFEARLVIPALELGWGIATLGSYAVKNYKALYALRFLVGLFESGFYPGIHYLLGSWYTPRELGKRAMIFWLAGSLGNMFSGFLQAAAYRTLNGVMALPVGGGSLSSMQSSLFLSLWPVLHSSLRRHCKTRRPGGCQMINTSCPKPVCIILVELDGRRGPKLESRPSSKAGIHMSFIWNNGGGQSAMGYWLKSFNDPINPPVPGKTYSVEDINQLPLPTKGIFIVSALAYAWLSDGPFRGRRWPFIYLNGAIAVVIGIILVKLDLYANIKKTMVLYWFQDFGSGAGPLILTWINEICSDDTEKRALLVAAGNDFAYVLQSIVPNFVWKTTDFPEARIGWTYSTAMNALLIVWTTLILLLLRRDEKRAIQSVSVTSIEAAIEDPDEKGVYTPQTTEQGSSSPLQKI
ncbi:hypothetical protein IAT40_001755 [Kwoniella sp. CBS 6097]